jgi:predicted  nucleic acid-binding Zn-ribbon protein
MKEDTRLALLEQSIGHINETLKDLKADMREMREEIKVFRKEVSEDIIGIKSDVSNFRKEINEKLDKEFKYIGNRSWAQFGFLFSLICIAMRFILKVKGIS